MVGLAKARPNNILHVCFILNINVGLNTTGDRARNGSSDVRGASYTT